MKRLCYKYKNRYQRAKTTTKDTKKVNKLYQNKYSTLSNAIKDHYKNLKSVREKKALKRILQGESIAKSKMKISIIRETMGIGQMKAMKLENNPSGKTLLVDIIKGFIDRDYVPRATAGKREIVTFKKIKMEKRYLLDTMKGLFR